ncbi:MAG: TonB-dependent receptor, partial [Pseudomonadota bacterium]
EDVARNVAGLTVQNLGPGQSQVAIRGVSAGQIVRDQPGVKEQVGVYLDESVISLSLFTPDLDLLDMNRVEVLRGPQGTLFGSGSLSGTVRYITNQPELGVNEGYGEITGNFLDDGDFGGAIRGMFNTELGEKSALRVAYWAESFGGFTDAATPNGRDEDVDEGTRFGVRAAMRFEPSERLTITPRLIYQDIDMDGFNRQDVYNILGNEFTTTRPQVRLGEREQYRQLEENFSDEFLLVDATVEYDFDAMTLTSVTSITDRDILVFRDATALTASITAQPNILDQPESVYTLDAPLSDTTDVEVFTQELRLASNTDDPLQWVAGFFYSDIERQYGQSLDVTGFEAATGIPTAGVLNGTDVLFFSDIPYDFTQIALFGEVSYEFSDRFNMAAGLRYYDFEEDRVLNFDGIFADQTIGQAGSTDADGFVPRVLASYALSDDVTLNGQISQGFRLGGINDPLNEPLCSPEDLATFGGRPDFEDEELWNYEIGIKSIVWDGRATFNAALFHQDIDDLQATLDAGTCSSRIIFNVPEASSTGIELEFTAQATDNFEFGVAASYVDAELGSTVTTTDPDGNVSVVGGIEDGNRLPTVPEFQMSANGTYTWDMSNGWEGFAIGSYQFVGDRFTQIGDQAPGFGTIDLTITPIGDPNQDTFSLDPELDDYQIVNFRLGARTADWEVALFINNLTDENAQLSLDRERGGRARLGYRTNPPRTFGITTRFNF